MHAFELILGLMVVVIGLAALADRRALVVLRDRGAIVDEALRRAERDLDLAEVRGGG